MLTIEQQRSAGVPDRRDDREVVASIGLLHTVFQMVF